MVIGLFSFDFEEVLSNNISINNNNNNMPFQLYVTIYRQHWLTGICHAGLVAAKTVDTLPVEAYVPSMCLLCAFYVPSMCLSKNRAT